MKKLLIPFIALLMIVALGSCSGSKEIAYFQNIDSISLAASKGLFDARIMPKDELTITVSGEDPEVVRPFNLTVQSTLNLSAASNLAGANECPRLLSPRYCSFVILYPSSSAAIIQYF